MNKAKVDTFMHPPTLPYEVMARPARAAVDAMQDEGFTVPAGYMLRLTFSCVPSNTPRVVGSVDIEPPKPRHFND